MPEWERVPLGEVLTRSRDTVAVDPQQTYKQVTVRMKHKGIVLREEKSGAAIGTTRQFLARPGQFIISSIDARNGANGLIPESLDGAIVTNDFWLFDIDQNRLDQDWLDLYSSTPDFVDACTAASEGTTNRVRLKEDRFLNLDIPLPPLPEQQRIVARVKSMLDKVEEARRLREEVDGELRNLLKSTIDEFLDGYDDTSRSLTDLLREGTQNGLSAKPTDDTSGTPILRISAATSRKDAYIDENDAKFLRLTDNELRKFQLEEGDLLACRFNGNLHFVGRFALYRAESGQVQVYPDKLIRFRVNREVLLPEYARLALNSTRSREQIEVFCATTAGNIGISAGNLKTISIPVPPMKMQAELISRVQELSRKIESATAFQNQTLQELQAFPASILAQAFAGGL